MPVAALPGGEVQLEVRVSGGHFRRGGRGLPGERRAAQVGVQQDAGPIDDPAQARGRPAGQPCGDAGQPLSVVCLPGRTLVGELVAERVGDQGPRVALLQPAVRRLVQE